MSDNNMMRNFYIYGSAMMGLLTLATGTATAAIAASPFFNTAAKVSPAEAAVCGIVMAAFTVLMGGETMDCVRNARHEHSIANSDTPAPLISG